MSEAADAYLAEIESAEAEAAGLLERAGPEDGELNASARHTISAMRGALRRRRAEIDGMREALRAEVRAELVAERKAEAAFRRLSVPPSARALFDGIDPTDQAAMQARADELREAGVTWNGQPGPPAPAPADPNLAAVMAMQTAAAGGVTMGSAGDLKTRMLDMAAHPDKYTDAQRDALVNEYNAAVDAAGRMGSGALG